MKYPGKKTENLRYFKIYKPYGVLSQFSDRSGRRTLAQYGPFPKDVYPVGRLDRDSEGLLFLTNDGRLKNLLIAPGFRHPRTYLVQVEKNPDEESLEKLREGVIIEGVKTSKSRVELLSGTPQIAPRPVPIRYRRNIPTAWLRLTIYEGRNRQVRKMTAAVGHPTLRLVRISIGTLRLGDLGPGESRPLTYDELRGLKDSVSGENRTGNRQ